MPRKKLQRSNDFPYHVTGRSNNRENFHLPLDEVWRIFESESLTLRILYDVKIHSLVLMPNHFHMLISVPTEDLGKIMCLFMANITKTINHRAGRSGHVFGGPYFWSIITSTRYYGHALKYIYRNPVRAQLCERVEEYRYSTIRGVLGFEHLCVPLAYTQIGMELNLPDFSYPFEWLDWLNTPFSTEAEEFIKQSLRKKEVRALLDRKTRTPIQILEQLL